MAWLARRTLDPPGPARGRPREAWTDGTVLWGRGRPVARHGDPSRGIPARVLDPILAREARDLGATRHYPRPRIRPGTLALAREVARLLPGAVWVRVPEDVLRGEG